MTPLSECRENASNRWETDLIMFLFFPISILWKVSVPVSLQLQKPQRYISLQTQTRFVPPVPRSAGATIAHRDFLRHLESSQKRLCLFTCRNEISGLPTQRSVGGPETRKMFYWIYLRTDQHLPGFRRRI